MNIDTLIRDAAEFIRAIDCVSDTPVIEEDLGDVENKIKTSIGKTSRCIVVGYGGSTPVKQGRGGPLVAKTKLVVSVFEKPSVNRKPGAPTALRIAQAVAREVQGCATEGMSSCLFFRSVTPLAELAGGVVSCDVIFDTDECL